LAIVQSVVSDHGGRISVQSKTGHGSTILIELLHNGTGPQRLSGTRHAREVVE